jgi:hypothetical protein
MTVSQPPVRAVRMLQRAGIDPSIVGDLMEEHAKGRSALWFWMQALGAIWAKAPGLVTTMRWLTVLPLAIVAVRVVIAITETAFFTFFRRDFAHGRFLLYGEGFLIAAAFLSTMVIVAPARKDSVARIALGVVFACSAMPIVLTVTSTDKTGLLVGLCGIVGGISTYGLHTRHCDSKQSRA